MTVAKPQTATVRSKQRPVKLPPFADYSDIVTDQHFDRIKTLVPESDYKDAEVVSGPAW